MRKYACQVLVIEINLVYNDIVGNNCWVGITLEGLKGKFNLLNCEDTTCGSDDPTTIDGRYPP